MQFVWGRLDSASPVRKLNEHFPLLLRKLFWFFLFFLWHMNITFFHCFVKDTSFKGTDSTFCLDKTFIRSLGQLAGQDQLGWLQSTGGMSESLGLFSKLQSAAHRQTAYPNVPLPVNTMPFCSGIWDQKGYMSARTSLQKQRHVRD